MVLLDQELVEPCRCKEVAVIIISIRETKVRMLEVLITKPRAKSRRVKDKWSSKEVTSCTMDMRQLNTVWTSILVQLNNSIFNRYRSAVIMDILLEAVADLGLEITEIAGVTIIDDYFKNKYFVNSNHPKSIRFTPIMNHTLIH